jgi:hypothetical protein
VTELYYLQFYKLCKRWQVEVDKNPHSLLERMKFEDGPEMSAALKDVTFRLGFNETMSTGEYSVTLIHTGGMPTGKLNREIRHTPSLASFHK